MTKLNKYNTQSSSLIGAPVNLAYPDKYNSEFKIQV